MQLLLAALALIGATPEEPVAEPPTNKFAAAMRKLGSRGLTGRALAPGHRESRSASSWPRDNPVGSDEPEGERAYLRKLRCSDGTAPSFERRARSDRVFTALSSTITA